MANVEFYSAIVCNDLPCFIISWFYNVSNLKEAIYYTGTLAHNAENSNSAQYHY